MTLIVDGIDDHGDGVNTTEVGVDVGPVRPRTEAGRDVVVHDNGGQNCLPDNLQERHGHETKVATGAQRRVRVLELYRESQALPEEVV